ncbi:hypothetical protein AgCh_031874 [Apium graveolens]
MIITNSLKSTRYADRVNAYWTRYFTSRPALKGYVRFLTGYDLPEDVVATALAGMVESTSKSSFGSPATKFQQENDYDILLVHFEML